MNILVIGGAGYIGSHVVRELLDNKYNVTVFDNLSTGSKDNLFREATFIHGDILSFESLMLTMKNGYDAIFHFAAFKAAGESMQHPQKYSLNNINGAINIINSASLNKIPYLIFSSTAAIYGEPQYLPIDENHPTIPENYYGFTKLEIERILAWYDKITNLKYAALRYFNAAGFDIHHRILGLEKNPQNLIPVVMEVAVGKREKLLIFGNDYPTRDGTGIRDYIHVNDLAIAHIKALQYIIKYNNSITLNLGSEIGISVHEIVEMSRKITQKPIPIEIVNRRDGDCAELFATSKKAEMMLEWKACYSDLETLIHTTWSNYSNM